ncbi:MAG: hypothetical protein PHU43_11220, partial [Candidatus Bipolaricaulis sp.]|nr:hypothetical protein [Candidatus Bipolaricaulis sp.]
ELAARLGIDEVYPVGERAAAACRAAGSPPTSFIARDRLAAHVAEQLSGEADAVVLVKGSHDVGLDRFVLDLLQTSSST